MPETVRLVLNRNSEAPYVLHREDCPTIRHRVRGDLREGTERTYYDAVYVSLEELGTMGRYRRCKTCAPDAPEGPPKAQAYLNKASTLTASDLGRTTADGAIVRVEHSAGGTVVTLDAGAVFTLSEGETVAFPNPNNVISPVTSTDGGAS